MIFFIIIPLCIISGPPKVGRRELRQKLISMESERFAPAIPRKFCITRTRNIDTLSCSFEACIPTKTIKQVYRSIQVRQCNEYYGPYRKTGKHQFSSSLCGIDTFRHLRSIQQRHSRFILKIKWNDFVAKVEVLHLAKAMTYNFFLTRTDCVGWVMLLVCQRQEQLRREEKSRTSYTQIQRYHQRHFQKR